MPSRLDRLRARLAVGPRTYSRIAYAAVAALTVIVFTGAAVRVTGSGLGCPEWPKCSTSSVTPQEIDPHVAIEFGNRMLSFLVTVATVAAFVFAWSRRPYRRDMLKLAAILPLGVLVQGVIGGVSVLVDLDYWSVMLHYLVSILLLVPAVLLAWKATEPADERRPPAAPDRTVAKAVRALAPLGFLTLFMGTAATAAGPNHGGSGTGDVVNRLDLKGEETLDFMIHQHGAVATVFGLAVLGVAYFAWRRGAGRPLLEPLGVTAFLLGSQGAIGGAQYAMELPEGLVWLHVVVATITWLALMWAVFSAGRPADAPAPVEPDADDRAPVAVGA